MGHPALWVPFEAARSAGMAWKWVLNLFAH